MFGTWQLVRKCVSGSKRLQWSSHPVPLLWCTIVLGPSLDYIYVRHICILSPHRSLCSDPHIGSLAALLNVSPGSWLKTLFKFPCVTISNVLSIWHNLWLMDCLQNRACIPWWCRTHLTPRVHEEVAIPYHTRENSVMAFSMPRFPDRPTL